MTTETLEKPISAAEPPAPRPRRALAWTAGVLAVLAVAVAGLAAVWDWNWFRGPVAGIASSRVHRQVTITGDLKVHPFSWQPSAEVTGVHIANPSWAGASPLADIDRIAVKIRLIPLFTGHWDLRLLEFDQPAFNLYRDPSGRATWDFSDGKDKDKPLRLPPIRNFIIDDGKVSYRDDERKLTFIGVIDAKERLGAVNHGFQMTGDGTINREPFKLVVTGGPLLNIDRDKPYPFDADIRSGATFVSARGAVPKPFDLAQFWMNVTARGPDLAELYELTGVPLPNTPPYALHGRLSRDVHLWKIDNLGGRVGSSDLGGDLSVLTGGPRPLLTADLTSSSLSFPDLGALFGGGGRPGGPASPAQAAISQKLRAEQRMLPDATLNVGKIRKIDADVSYRAQTIRDAPIHLKAGSVKVKLNDGVLRADPLALDLPQGQVSGWINLDARKGAPVTEVDLWLRNARLEHLVPLTFQGATPYAGALVGRAQLRGSGDSVHKAFGHANGQVELVVPGGQINAAVAELLGVNLTKGLGLLSSKTRETTAIRCGVAHFQATDGVLNADHIVLDTGPVLITGEGRVNLDTERLAFKIQGHPKAFRLVRVLLPITVEGPILQPKLGFKTGGAIAQGGVALALSAVLSPLAAVLPFVDPGLAKDANCAALLAEGKAQGAPVKALSPTPAH